MFLEAAQDALEALAADTADGGPGLIVGGPWRRDAEARPPLFGKVFNTAYVIDGGGVTTHRAKHNLPNYGVFDEKRVFSAGPLPGPVNFRGVRLGVMICEDMWAPAVSECLEESGAALLIVLHASPSGPHTPQDRLHLTVHRTGATGPPP